MAAAVPPPAYTLRATEACLASRPDAIVGLPPASPPATPALFVDALARDDLSTWGAGQPRPRRHRELAVWVGTGRNYDGIVLSFFGSVADAHASVKSVTWLYGGTLVRNVVASWDEKPAPAPRVRRAVLGCLRSRVPRRRSRRLPVPAASVATFAGGWGGHTRRLAVTAAGRGTEGADDGCCRAAYRLTFQIVSVSGTLTRATARYRVLTVERGEDPLRKVRAGEVGELVLRDGIVRNLLTDDFFCSGPGWATGACGA